MYRFLESTGKNSHAILWVFSGVVKTVDASDGNSLLGVGDLGENWPLGHEIAGGTRARHIPVHA